RVAVGGHAVGRPAGLPDAAGGVGALAAAERRLEVGELAGVLLDVHRGAETLDPGRRPVEDQRDPRRVVTTVLESAQAVEHDVDGLALAYVSHDSTHAKHPTAVSSMSGARMAGD